MRPSILIPLCAAAAVLVPAVSQAAVVVRVGPPRAIVEPVPVAPAVGYAWRPGYWSWNGRRYVWVQGAYVAPPRPGVVWVPGYWAHRPRGWVWVEGRWR